MWPQLAHWQEGREVSPKERGGGVFIGLCSFLISILRKNAHFYSYLFFARFWDRI